MSANALIKSLLAGKATLLTTMAATGYSAPLDCRNFRNARITLRTTNHTNSPAGTFTLEGSDDYAGIEQDKADGAYGGSESAQWVKLTLPDGSVHGTSGTVLAFSGPSTDITCDGSGSLSAIIDVVNPPAFLRLKYTKSSGGGSATDLRVQGGLREE